MKRTQIQLDESTFAQLRELSYRREVSVAQLIREAIDMAYGTAPRAIRDGDLGFVGGGRSQQSPLRPVSEDHDAALEEAYRD
jgi:hypothetical protein